MNRSPLWTRKRQRYDYQLAAYRVDDRGRVTPSAPRRPVDVISPGIYRLSSRNASRTPAASFVIALPKRYTNFDERTSRADIVIGIVSVSAGYPSRRDGVRLSRGTRNAV